MVPEVAGKSLRKIKIKIRMGEAERPRGQEVRNIIQTHLIQSVTAIIDTVRKLGIV